MKVKVYLTSVRKYDEKSIAGIYWTPEGAQKAIKESQNEKEYYNRMNDEIEEYEIEGEIPFDNIKRYLDKYGYKK